jgi:hypothetical protein
MAAVSPEEAERLWRLWPADAIAGLCGDAARLEAAAGISRSVTDRSDSQLGSVFPAGVEAVETLHLRGLRAAAPRIVMGTPGAAAPATTV